MRQSIALAGGSLLVLSMLCTPALAADAPPADNEIEAVVVTGSPYAVSLDSVTTSISVVSRDDLDIAPPVGLGDLLASQPGLRSTFFGPGASRPVIRGLSGPRVLVLQNGVGLVDASALSPDHAVASEPGEASRIEVLRGPSTLAYGGAGIGGVVNVIDDRIPTHAPTDGFEGRISASTATGDDGRSAAFGLKAGSGPFVFAVDGVSRRSDDYQVPGTPVSDRLAKAEGLTPDPAREVRNTDTRLDSYGVGASYIFDGGYVGLSVKQTDTTYGVPEAQILAPIDPDAEGPVAIDLQQTRYDFRAEVPFAAGPFSLVRTSVGYADYEHAEISRVDGAVGTRFLSDGVEGRIELVQRETEILKGAVGVQGLQRHFDSVGDEASIPRTDTKEIGVFTLQRLDFGNWGLDGGLRFDHRELESRLAGRVASAPATQYGIDWTTADNAPSFSNVSASLGVFFKPTDGQFYALTVARSARAPTEAELYSDGPHPGTGAYELGDPTLDSEAVVSIEATGRWTFDRIRGEAHLWWADYDGYIEQAATGDVEDGLPVFRYYATGARFHGFEAQATYDLWQSEGRSLAVEASADMVRGDTDGGIPARIPPWSVSSRLIWESDMFDGRLEVRHVAEQNRVAANELPTDSYTMVNLYGAVKPFKDPDLRLFLDARNLTDVVAREHVSFLKDVAPLPGRSFRLGFAWRF
jgi:iron complex outermembrane recepter protein